MPYVVIKGGCTSMNRTTMPKSSLHGVEVLGGRGGGEKYTCTCVEATESYHKALARM